MQDESLIDEMRTALKGDRDRAELRRGAAPAEQPERAGASGAPAPPERRGLIARLARRRARA